MSSQDWDSQHYKKNSEAQTQGAISTLNNFSFKGNENVLDIGCGDGKVTQEIAQKVPNGTVVGIDPSENMIEECTKSFSRIKNLSFEKTCAEEFVSDSTFDLVVSFSALHYVENHEKVLSNIFQSLKPGGTLIAFMSGGNQPDVEKIFNSPKWKSLLPEKLEWHSQTEDNYKLMLEKSGFKKIVTRTDWKSRFYEKKEGLINWAMSWIPYVTGFDAENSKEFAIEIVENIAKGKESNIEMKSPLLYIQAKKPE